jgi:hypothetical protein
MDKPLCVKSLSEFDGEDIPDIIESLTRILERAKREGYETAYLNLLDGKWSCGSPTLEFYGLNKKSGE